MLSTLDDDVFAGYAEARGAAPGSMTGIERVVMTAS
jgi:hypothetical protein